MEIRFIDILVGDDVEGHGVCLHVEEGHKKTAGYRIHEFSDHTIMTSHGSEVVAQVTRG